MSICCEADHVVYAFDVLIHSLSDGERRKPTPSFENLECPLFVTWNKIGRPNDMPRLRGCIGTFEPKPLHFGLRDYALTSALRDHRFDPISLSELPFLSCTVSLLHSFEFGTSWDDWEIGIHGITIEFKDPHSRVRRNATFLPEIASHEGWDKEETLEHLIRKSGCRRGDVSQICKSIKLTRYQSTTFSLSYDDYQRLTEPKSYRGAEKAEKSKAEESITVPAG